MRFLNMRDLSHVRRTQLANHTELAKGSFATVYAESVDSATVAKITTDKYSYDLLTDGMWLQMREHVESSFTRVIEDHGDVGESRGLTAYLVEVERLHRISTTEHRRLISRWMKEYTASRHEDFVAQTCIETPVEVLRSVSRRRTTSRTHTALCLRRCLTSCATTAERST